MEATVEWSGDQIFTGRGEEPLSVELQSGGAPVDQRSGFSPMQLLLIGMIGCTAMDVISILGRMRQDVSRFQVKAEADQQEGHPRVFSHIQLEYSFVGPDLDSQLVERAIQLSLTKYCPATAMLRKTASVDFSYRLNGES